MKRSKISQGKLAGLLPSISQTLVSQWLLRKYWGNNRKIDATMKQWIEARQTGQQDDPSGKSGRLTTAEEIAEVKAKTGTVFATQTEMRSAFKAVGGKRAYMTKYARQGQADEAAADASGTPEQGPKTKTSAQGRSPVFHRKRVLFISSLGSTLCACMRGHIP